jgi:hypothetical protein
MTAREATESELRACCAEAVGTLRVISESAGPLGKARVRRLLLEAERAISAACELADRLP